MDKVKSVSKYNRKDHTNYYKYHMLHRSKSTYFIIFVMLVVIGWSIYNSVNMSDPQQIMISWSLAAFTVLMAPLLMTVQINNIVKKESQERKESSDIITVTKDKIIKNNDKTEGKVVIGWHQVDAIHENKKYIYIYTGQNQGIFMVKEDIIEGDVESLRKIAEKCMKRNRRGKINYKEYPRRKKQK